MFGALGWGLMTLSCGSLVDWFSGDASDKNYRILYYIGCIALSIDLYIVYQMKVGLSISLLVLMYASSWLMSFYVFRYNKKLFRLQFSKM